MQAHQSKILHYLLAVVIASVKKEVMAAIDKPVSYGGQTTEAIVVKTAHAKVISESASKMYSMQLALKHASGGGGLEACVHCMHSVCALALQ